MKSVFCKGGEGDANSPPNHSHRAGPHPFPPLRILSIMVEKKMKSRGSERPSRKRRQQSMSKTLPNDKNHKKKQHLGNRKRTGPRLPNALRKELERLNPSRPSGGGGEEIDSDEAELGSGRDVYEYEEEAPQEESGRNRRFDPVDNLEYELPDEFEVIEICSLPVFLGRKRVDHP